MKDAVDLLNKRIAELDRDCHIYDEQVLELKGRIAELEAEIERLRPDAERYRWLRDNPEHESLPYYEDDKFHFPYQIYGHGGTGGGVALRTFDTLDAAIDAAMEVE